MPPGSRNNPTLCLKPCPPDRVFDVVVRGELVTPLPERDYGSIRRWHLMYVFEARYRRTVERSDGYRITERHDYETVRSAKLLLPMSEGKSASKARSDWSLAGMEFPCGEPGDLRGFATDTRLAPAGT